MYRFYFIKKVITLCVIFSFSVTSLLCFSDTLSNSQASKNQTSTNKKLNDVKYEISTTQSDLEVVNTKRKNLENALKENDLAISIVINNIQKNNKNKTLFEEELLALTKQKKLLLEKKTNQEKILAKQLRAAYSAGHHDYIKLLLNQQDPAAIQRTISHYQYINNARIEEIKNFKHIIDELVILEEEYDVKSKKLLATTEQLKTNKNTLEKNKLERKETLALLKKEQLSKEQQLDKLLSEEAELSGTLRKLEVSAKSNKNLRGLATLKRKLKWPVVGKIIHKFGTQKQGYVKWKGVLTKADLGQQVKSIYSGRVLFSDWLQGYGLVTIIDHGKGYMSLYGYNQTLLKKEGDYVEQGEPISLVGQSGGQLQPGLYFEIRHTGQAQNPKLWCK